MNGPVASGRTIVPNKRGAERTANQRKSQTWGLEESSVLSVLLLLLLLPNRPDAELRSQLEADSWLIFIPRND